LLPRIESRMVPMEELHPNSSQPQVSAPDADEVVLLEFLRTHDEFCPLRKYNLRNLTLPRCPECGRGLRLTVGMTEPYLLPWVLLTVFTAMAASIGVVFTLAIMMAGLPSLNDLSWREIAPGMGACWGVSCIPLTLVWVLGRRIVLRWARSVQWTLAAIVFIINFVLLAATFVSIR
jgi:hypothetical protein